MITPFAFLALLLIKEKTSFYCLRIVDARDTLPDHSVQGSNFK